MNNSSFYTRLVYATMRPAYAALEVAYATFILAEFLVMN